jgi:hypothetical protein
MLYMLFIYADEAAWEAQGAAEQAEVMRAHDELEQSLRKAGKYRGCAGLAPTRDATTLRRSGGRRLVTDGPYAETKEQLGGYYLVDARDLDDALEIAGRIPAIVNASIELRPVVDLRS